MFTPSTSTRTFGADDDVVLVVPDLVSVTSLKVDDNDDGVFETTIAANDYELDTYREDDGWPWEIVRLLNRQWPANGRRRRRIEIDATWGWSATSSPINQACTLLALRIAQRPSAALVLMSTFTSVRAMAARYYLPGILVSDPFDTLAVVEHYPNPILLIHGSQDFGSSTLPLFPESQCLAQRLLLVANAAAFDGLVDERRSAIDRQFAQGEHDFNRPPGAGKRRW